MTERVALVLILVAAAAGTWVTARTASRIEIDGRRPPRWEDGRYDGLREHLQGARFAALLGDFTFDELRLRQVFLQYAVTPVAVLSTTRDWRAPLPLDAGLAIVVETEDAASAERILAHVTARATQADLVVSRSSVAHGLVVLRFRRS